VEVGEAAVNIDHLVPCALIVNELVCNAFKYAFRDRRSGKVCVNLFKNGGRVTLRVSDDGIGFRSSVESAASGVGKQIVRALVGQLSGTLEWTNGQGSTATITFPETT
jgi:two-component sensor histidine kinase